MTSRVITSPLIRAAPTTPTGESSLRSPSLKAAFHRSGTFDGRATMDSTPFSIMSPMRSTESPKDSGRISVWAAKPR